MELLLTVLSNPPKIQQKKEPFPFWKFTLLAQHQHCNGVKMLTLTWHAVTAALLGKPPLPEKMFFGKLPN